MKKIIIILFCLLFLSGCYDYRELNEIAIVNAMGIEMDKGLYKVSAQIINVKKTDMVSYGESAKIIMFYGKGKTVYEAIKDIEITSSKKLFLAHVRLVIFDKSFIGDKISDVTDYLSRDTDIDLSFYCATTSDNTPSEILETITPLGTLPAVDLINSLKVSALDHGTTSLVTFKDLLDMSLKKGINLSLPNINLTKKKNDKDKDNTELLKDTKLSTYILADELVIHDFENNIVVLSKNESLGINILKNKLKTSLITLKCDSEFYTMEINKGKTKMNYDKENNSINIVVSVSSTVGEYNCKDDISKKDINNMRGKEIEKRIKDIINNTIENAKKNKSDYIGIGNFIYKNYNKFYPSTEKEYNEVIFPNMNVKVLVNNKVYKDGNLMSSIKKGKR
ncbi:MAG: Ger(x)C family spore germination protein [Bacilli bacterium]